MDVTVQTLPLVIFLCFIIHSVITMSPGKGELFDFGVGHFCFFISRWVAGYSEAKERR